MAFIFAICLFAATPPGAGLTAVAYAEEEGASHNSTQLWCHMCNKPFPCGYEYHDDVRQELTTHVDSGDGTIVEYVTSTGSGYIPSESPNHAIDTGAALIDDGQNQGGGDAFSGLDGQASSGPGKTDSDLTVLEQETPTGAFSGIWTGLNDLMGDTLLDEDGGVKTWAKAAGAIIIALIALGIVYSSVRLARRRRRKKARSL